MLQREMDGTADYAVQLVEPKQGFLEKIIKKYIQLKLTNSIPVITRKVSNNRSDRILDRVSKKASTWGWLKYLGRLGLPAQILSIVTLGTLLGAAYAVTMQTGNRIVVKKEASTVATSQEIFPEPEQTSALEKVTTLIETTEEPVLQAQELKQQEDVIFEQIAIPDVLSLEDDLEPILEAKTTKLKVSDVMEKDLMLALNDSIDDLSTTTDSQKTIKPKETVSNAPAEDSAGTALNKYDHEKIKELEQKIFAIKKKTEQYNLSNLRLEGKLELLTVKNKALSVQLRHLDDVRDSLEAGYQGED